MDVRHALRSLSGRDWRWVRPEDLDELEHWPERRDEPPGRDGEAETESTQRSVH